jgi:hypothetical protein
LGRREVELPNVGNRGGVDLARPPKTRPSSHDERIAARRVNGMRGFAKAVMVGSLVGAVLPLCISVPVAVDDFAHPLTGHVNSLNDVYLAALPLIVSLSIVLASSLVVGLPVSWLLRRLHAESLEAYGSIGAVFGVLIPIGLLLLFRAEGGYWLAVLGAFSGVATALTWWSERQSATSRRSPHKADAGNSR